MKFISYVFNGNEAYGILNKDGTGVVPMDIILTQLNKETPKTLLDFILAYSDKLIPNLQKIIVDCSDNTISLADIKITAPIPYPRRNVFCLGKNYADHAMEIRSMASGPGPIPEDPIYFTKIAYPAMGHMDKVIIPKGYTEKIDYEVELAIIIGKDGKNILPEEAEDYIFGYTIGNDISARDVQTKHAQWFKGKSLDTFTPIGPYLVHKSEIEFPVELDIVCKVNDEIRQNSNTSNLIFDIPTIISDLSKGLTLRAGDIILTGTPAGVGIGFKPHKYLKSGDVVECYIEKIGTLINTIE